ncbi:hypothetical protein Hypma_004141 [Hypsizygus marmoreus]|uniref:F-box domain-containing protein n=1 Tax=Hypsizygus marmoreus TaxID=39966 RepID=A0A369J2E4_HYPMA|nr:hypothetical protein Hypma_004141 [Hypsizygus marmoreus]
MRRDHLLLITLDDDVLQAIFDEFNYILRYDNKVPVIRPRLLPLSCTCKRLREMLAPSIFKQVTNQRPFVRVSEANEFWPTTIWKFIETVSINDEQWSMNFETIAFIIPQLPNLKRVSFRMDQPPPKMLLNAIALAGISILELADVRLDGPALTEIFSHTKLTHLISTVGRRRPMDLNAADELKHTSDILSIVSKTLVYLKISGDLVSFETLARLDWPCLCTLTLIDHIPYGKVIPLPTVIARMPCLRNLHYNFGAVSTGRRIPPIIFWYDGQGSAPLAVTHPHLKSLSLSNIYPAEHTLDHLPQSLRSLRILALRERTRQDLSGPWYPFSPLREEDAFRIIAKAAFLPDLVDLALTLQGLPTPAVIEAVAKSCPGLRFLEISQGDFELHCAESPYSIESLAEPLACLHHLHELRISVGFGSQLTSSLYRGLKDKTPLYRRMEMAGSIFAQKLTNLNTISFSFGNDGCYYRFQEYVVWCRYSIVSGVDGKPPVALADLECLYETSSEPDNNLCGFASKRLPLNATDGSMS